MRTARAETKGGWRHGPSWGVVILTLLVLGVMTISLGFDLALYAEYGARSTCRGGVFSAPAPLESDPEELVTLTINEDCESSVGNVHTFTGTRQEADQWEEQTLNRLVAEQEAPVLRSKLSSTSSTVGWVGVGLILAALAVGVWRAMARAKASPDRNQADLS